MQLTILIDWQNLFKACENNIPLDTVIGEITKKGLSKGEIQEIRLFVPLYQSLSPWRTINWLQCKYSVEVSVCATLRKDEGTESETLMKDTVDFEILKWITKHVYLGVGPETIVFVSSDGHFIVSSNEAKRKGKRVEFWFVDISKVSGLIREQEEFREIKISPPILLTEENPFLSTLDKLNKQEPLNSEDQRRLEILAAMEKVGMEKIVKTPATNGLSTMLGGELGLEETGSKQLLEALMALGVARIYPAISQTISIDTSSPLFQWISAFH
jgi:uncharacterized LabA/DUF88 family protein